MNDTLRALAGEAGRVHALLEGLGEDDWGRPTRCPPLTVHELAAHALRGVVRIEEMLAAGPAGGPPEKDGVTYFDYDPAAIAGGVVTRSQETAREYPAGGFPERWRTGWDAIVARVGEILGREDPVLKGVFGTIALSEYLRTRSVEVVVHHMDLRDAFGLEPDPDRDALASVVGVLAQRLGADPTASGMDPVRFALVATGRSVPDERERGLLGEAADRVPVLS